MILLVQTLEQPLLITLSVSAKLVPQTAPAVTLTVWALAGPLIEPLPLSVQEYVLMPAGPVNWEVDFGQTKLGPVMELAGIGVTFKTTSEVSVQPLDWITVNRKVALAEETCVVVIREVGESMTALPETTLQVVEAIGCRPCVAWP
jgi:hypothetical protein